MRILLTSRKFDVVRQPVARPDGGWADYDIIRHPGAAVVLPLLDESTCVLIHNQRPAVGRRLWELPAGTLDRSEEPPIEAARRELEEETGYRAGRMEALCDFYTSPGVMSERIFAFVAFELTAGAQRLEDTEDLVVHPTPLTMALAMVDDGRINDGKTVIALLTWERRRGRA